MAFCNESSVILLSVNTVAVRGVLSVVFIDSITRTYRAFVCTYVCIYVYLCMYLCMCLYACMYAVAYPGILFGGVSTNSVEDRGQRERGSGGGSPLVSASGGSCNLVQEISFQIVKFS